MKQLNIKKTITIVVITVFAVLSLSGCTTFENFKEAFIDKPQNKEDTILIGVFEPMSGADKEGASLEVEGIKLANEMYLLRSEERRVGKECRSRWSPYH